MHHRTIQINHQPDATIFHFIILTFVYSSTCFGRFPAHHQEPNDCSGSLWFYLRIVVIVVLCSWSGRPAGCTMSLGSTQPLTKMNTKKISWGKCGRCVGLTTLPLLCTDCHEIWKLQPPETLRACPGLYRDCFPFKGLGQLSRYSDSLRSWASRGANPGGREISHTRSDRPWGLHSLLYNG